MKIWYVNDSGKCVKGEAELYLGDIPFDDAEDLMRRSPFFKAIAAAEHDLLDRYHRGELT